MELSEADRRRFWAKVDKRGDCWPWTGGCNPYGQFWVGSIGRCTGAHTVALMLTAGPGSGFVLHTCDNPPCCNPAHLYYGSPAQNMKDRDERGRTARGEKQHLARLTEDAVRAMRTAYADGISTPALGRRFGVHTATAHRVVTRQTWRHVA